MTESQENISSEEEIGRDVDILLETKPKSKKYTLSAALSKEEKDMLLEYCKSQGIKPSDLVRTYLNQLGIIKDV
jgi:hypothetical protein